MLDGIFLPTPRLDEDGAITLNRERLNLANVLQENRVLEPGDLPTQRHTVQARPLTRAGSQSEEEFEALPPHLSASA